LIGLYYRPRVEPIPEPARPGDFQGTPETTMPEVRQFLASVGLKESACGNGDLSYCLILPSGAQISFDGQQLQSIIFAHRSNRPAMKQVSVSISEETWNQLRTLARETNRKVPDMLAEWSTQRASENTP